MTTLSSSGASNPDVADVVSVRIDGETIHAYGAVAEHGVDLLLGAVDYLTRNHAEVTLDLTHVSALDSQAVRDLYTARYDALAAGSVLQLLVPAHLQRRLAACRPLTARFQRPPRQVRPLS
jgi:hypothetical protein